MLGNTNEMVFAEAFRYPFRYLVSGKFIIIIIVDFKNTLVLTLNDIGLFSGVNFIDQLRGVSSDFKCDQLSLMSVVR